MTNHILGTASKVSRIRRHLPLPMATDCTDPIILHSPTAMGSIIASDDMIFASDGPILPDPDETRRREWRRFGVRWITAEAEEYRKEGFVQEEGQETLRPIAVKWRRLVARNSLLF
ncbi:PREDICTED: uncharacterized protein LOC104824708 [Tarenaya hassleriana]|uniref:uncharacterized protein LOC104824705 n=1 Tax=Tarenaya hassleriana TaxID=28532 RepID=UPI00053C67FA|nr:PREDICTED: uncharacterized protein LOC104824705 [Tarenaya hassleriana]XP_010555130.1 PREDICTED: uncharacterized protein LOC104824708 [Tarenaya hassleriana]